MRLCRCARKVILLVLIAPGMMRAQAADESAEKAKIRALENIWNQAVVLRDLKTLDVLFDADLAYIGSDGALMTKAEFLALVRSFHPQGLATNINNIQIHDDTAVVNGTYRFKELRNGTLLVQEGRFTNTWIYKGSSWVCVAAQDTPILPSAGK